MEPLTRRQREVASLVAQGLTNRDIAERLMLSERTAEGHVEQIRLKLGARSRSQVVAWLLADRAAHAATGPSGSEIRYAKSGSVDIAYELTGLDGPDLLAFSSAVLPIDSMNDEPSLVRFSDRLASFSRVICAGHAFMQNLRRGHYELGVEAPANQRVAAAFTQLAHAI